MTASDPARLRCGTCEHLNRADAQFCESCQAYLGWGSQPDAGSASGPGPGHGPAPGPSPAPGPVPGTEPGPGPVPTPAGPSSGNSPDRPVGLRRPGELDPVPPSPGPPQPLAPPVPPQPAADQQPAAGGRCPQCAADNPAGRHLCRRCGAPLAAVRTARRSRTPWWRRLLRRRTRSLPAGTRPEARGRRRWPRPRLSLPVVLLILAAAGWLARSQLAEVYHFALDRTSKSPPLHPSASASSEAHGHPAKAAFDGYSNRYWTPAAPGSGAGQYLEARFDRPVRLTNMLVHSGRSDNAGDFLTQGRPEKIIVTLTADDGDTTNKTITLEDTPGEQPVDVHGRDVVRVRLTVNTSYGVHGQRRPAIAEVEFFGRQ